MASRLALAAAAAAAIAVVVGSALTWAAADVPLLGRVELSGFGPHREGAVTLALGAALLLAIAAPVQRRARALAAVGLSAAALGVAVTDAAELAARRGIVEGWGLGYVDTDVGAGLIVVLTGATVAVVASLLALTLALPRPHSPHPPSVTPATEDSP